MRLTDKAIAAIAVPIGKAEIIVFDDLLAGFGLRVRQGGSRRFIYQYKIGNANRRFTFKETDARKARQAAEALAAKVTLGSDPALEKRAAREAAGDTFKHCLDQYLSRPDKRRASTLREIGRHLLRNLASLHRLHIKNLDRRLIAEELRRLTTKCGAVQANRTRASLSAFLGWCMREGYCDTNIALATNKNDETPRDRCLSNAELRVVWRALGEGDFADATRLLILTGARREEISQLRWNEIDLENGIISLPPSRTKNRRPHIIPLSQPALAILRARKQNGREPIFGVRGRGFSTWHRSKAALGDGLKSWRFHDLRRSCATGLATLQVQPHIIEAVLNHVSFKAGVHGIYNHHGYENEKRQALDLWAKHITELVGKRDE